MATVDKANDEALLLPGVMYVIVNDERKNILLKLQPTITVEQCVRVPSNRIQTLPLLLSIEHPGVNYDP